MTASIHWTIYFHFLFIVTFFTFSHSFGHSFISYRELIKYFSALNFSSFPSKILTFSYITCLWIHSHFISSAIFSKAITLLVSLFRWHYLLFLFFCVWMFLTKMCFLLQPTYLIRILFTLFHNQIIIHIC